RRRGGCRRDPGNPRAPRPPCLGDRPCRGRSKQIRPAAAREADRHRQAVPAGMSHLLDPEALDMLVEAIGEDAARRVLALFLEECRDLTAIIAAAGADHVAIGRAAHSLKSSAGQLGAVALSETAIAVETAAAANVAALPALIAALSECAAATREALAARLAA